jgi:hypothetical protein
VEPRPLLAAHGGQLRQRVDRPGAGGPGAGGHEQRPPAGALVGGQRGRQRLRAHPVAVVHREHPHLVGAEPEDPGGPGHGGVGLVGEVGDHLVGHGPEQRLPGAGERGQVGRRAAADQHPGRLLGVADPLLEPAQHHQLQLAGTGGLDPGAGLDVAGAGDQVAEHARPGPGAGNVGEEAGVVVQAEERQDVAAELLEDALETLGAFRRRLVQPAGQLGRRAPAQHRLLAQPGEPVHQQVDGPVSELSHGLGVDLERAPLHPSHPPKVGLEAADMVACARSPALRSGRGVPSVVQTPGRPHNAGSAAAGGGRWRASGRP